MLFVESNESMILMYIYDTCLDKWPDQTLLRCHICWVSLTQRLCEINVRVIGGQQQQACEDKKHGSSMNFQEAL